MNNIRGLERATGGQEIKKRLEILLQRRQICGILEDTLQ